MQQRILYGTLQRKECGLGTWAGNHTAIWWNDWEYREKLDAVILQAYINI
jgi:hypothetical protein